MPPEKWRLIIDGARNAYWNMALDEALLRGKESTLRIYEWRPPAVSIGYFQEVKEEVDVEELKKRGFDLVRRITGGGAVLHQWEITYSLTFPEEFASESISESYREICEGIVIFLRNLGLNASFSPINDVLVEGRKISGNAQTRKWGRILQHGTLLLDLDLEAMFSVLRVSREKVSDKLIKDVKGRVTCLNWELGGIPNKDEMKVLLSEGFSEALGVEFSESKFTKSEIELARELVSKYSSDEWTFMR